MYKTIKSICNELINVGASDICGLLGDEVGYTYLTGVLYVNTKDDLYYKLSQEYINKLYIKSNSVNNYSLGYGKSGVLWTFERLHKLGLFPEGHDYVLDNMDAVKRSCCEMIERGNLDYFEGALGVLYYLYASDNVDLELLQALKQKVYERYPIKKNQYHENVNLGVPHGITGILLFFIMIKEKTLTCEFDPIINDISNYFLSVHEKINSYKFPSILEIDNPKDRKPFTLAWCYGNLCIIYALKKSGILLSQKRYEVFAFKLLSETRQRTDYYSNNLTLCHGLGVITLLYKIISKLFDSELLHNTNNYWIDLFSRVFNESFDQFLLHKDVNEIYNSRSMFYGVSGTLLALLECNNKIHVNWDFLLINYDETKNICSM